MKLTTIAQLNYTRLVLAEIEYFFRFFYDFLNMDRFYLGGGY